MAEVVYGAVVEETRLIPGETVEATMNVSGARTVQLLIYIPPAPPLPPHSPAPPTSNSVVSWTLSFGPTPSGGPLYVQTNSGTLQADSPAAIAVPVFGPSLNVVFENQGTEDISVAGTIYFIQEVSPIIVRDQP